MKTIALFSLLFFSFCRAQEKFFDPDGYYTPASKILSQHTRIEYFELRTLDYYDGGRARYEHPRFLEPVIALLINQHGAVKRIESKSVKVTRDSLTFEFSQTDFGTVHFAGVFKDKRGVFWDRKDIIPNKTVILSGILEIRQAGKLMYSKHHNFTYANGD